MNIDFVSFKKRLREKSIESELPLVGFSEPEVVEIEMKIGRKLPFNYRKFLLNFGRNAGPLLQGMDYGNYSQELPQTRFLIRLMSKHAGLVIPDDAFAFVNLQGYIYYFFRLNDEDFDDPMVYGCHERFNEIKPIGRFSSFILEDFESIDKEANAEFYKKFVQE